jgi:hypothetical protein
LPDGPTAVVPDSAADLQADGSKQTMDAISVAPDATGLECSKLAQAADAKNIDETYNYDQTERTGGYFQPGTYTLVQLVYLVGYQDPRLGTKTGRSVQETWRVRRVGDANQWETYLDLVRDGLGVPNEQSATFHMQLMRDGGSGSNNVWKLVRVCGDSTLDDLDGAVLNVDMPLMALRLPWGTAGTAKDGSPWRRRFACMGHPCRGDEGLRP